MSVENGKVCCNCRHCKRIQKENGTLIECRCDRDNAYLTYATVLGHWCRHWAKERENEKMSKIRPVDAKWIITYHKSLMGTWNGWYGYKCSACKKTFVEGRDIYESARFCPNCGAAIVDTQHLKDKVEWGNEKRHRY